MSGIFEMFLSTSIGLAGGYMVYLVQYRRDKRIEARARMRLLVRLLDDFILDLHDTDGHYSNFIAELNNNIYELPSLKIVNHPSVKMLTDSVQTEECHSSFMRIVGGVIGSEEQLYTLQMQSWKASCTMENVQAVFAKTEGYTNDFVDKIIELQKKLEKLRKKYHDGNGAQRTAVDAIFDNYEQATQNTDYSELYEIEGYLIGPLSALAPGQGDDTLAEIIDTVIDIRFLLQEIPVGHNSLAEEIQKLQKELQQQRETLGEVQQFFRRDYVRGCYGEWG